MQFNQTEAKMEMQKMQQAMQTQMSEMLQKLQSGSPVAVAVSMTAAGT